MSTPTLPQLIAEETIIDLLTTHLPGDPDYLLLQPGPLANHLIALLPPPHPRQQIFCYFGHTPYRLTGGRWRPEPLPSTYMPQSLWERLLRRPKRPTAYVLLHRLGQ